MSHFTWKFMGFFQVSYDIDFSHISTVIREQTMILVPLDNEIFAPCFTSLDMFQYLLFYSLCMLCYAMLCYAMLSCFSHIRLFVTLWTEAHGLLCRWHSLGKNTGVGCHALIQGIFPTQGSNPGLLTADGFFTSWATREAQEHWSG